MIIQIDHFEVMDFGHFPPCVVAIGVVWHAQSGFPRCDCTAQLPDRGGG